MTRQRWLLVLTGLECMAFLLLLAVMLAVCLHACVLK